jgi:ribosomal protein S19
MAGVLSEVNPRDRLLFPLLNSALLALLKVFGGFLNLVKKLINFCLKVRSSWKGNFYAPPVLRLHNRLSREGISSDFKGIFYNRSSTVPPSLRGYQFSLFLGKDFVDGGIRREMVGFRFGEFFVTKCLGSRIHVAKKTTPVKVKSKTQK